MDDIHIINFMETNYFIRAKDLDEASTKLVEYLDTQEENDGYSERQVRNTFIHGRVLVRCSHDIKDIYEVV